VSAAVLEPDLAEMANGLDMLVGPRGVRLSGGQIRRTAAALNFLPDMDWAGLGRKRSAGDDAGVAPHGKHVNAVCHEAHGHYRDGPWPEQPRQRLERAC
jgi:hypothetical protein